MDRTDEAGVKLFLTEQDKLNELLYHEEVYWKQRAKTFWLQEGDANTRFFHASATTRKKTNHVSWLKSETGDRVENHDGMCRIVQDYYTNIFADSNEVDIELSESSTSVSDEQNSMLVGEVTFEEFSLAIKQMHPDKASGPDGLNPAFFQQFWKDMGREVYECCKVWLKKCSFSAEFNSTNLVLIRRNRRQIV